MQNAQVLIVDDEADVIQALKLRLETEGYHTITASDGAQALDLLRSGRVDLILSDLMMPHLDGLELTRRIRQDPKLREVRILLFSCLEDPVSEGLAREFGALDYLSKTIGAPAIVSRVREILATSKPSSDSSSAKERTTEQAERDLIVQLRALSEMSSPITSPRQNSSKALRQSGQHATQPRGKDDQLLDLARNLESSGEAKHGPH